MTNKRFIEDSIGYVELMEVFGSDLTVVNAARVSFNKESEMVDVVDQDTGVVTGSDLAARDKGLIDYLAKYQHITPFFHPVLRFRLKMPIFVAREWFRHGIGFARNEVSRRYVFDRPECFVPQHFRKRDKSVKQGSSTEIIEQNEQVHEQMMQFCEQTINYYENLLEQGVCPEQARMVLPQSMYTEFIETASLSAYARLVKLRVEATAQKEIQDYARYVSDLAQNHFPVSWAALMKY